jgi:hypothetical protein
VIFRYLYKRRLFAAFEQFMDRAKLEELAAQTATTEWQALKSFLPWRWFYSVEQRSAALREVARLATHYSQGHKDEPPTAT